MSAYGPSILVVIVAFSSRVALSLYRTRRIVIDENHFYFGLPLLWSSLALALGQLLLMPQQFAEANASLVAVFLFAWTACFLWVYGWHSTYGEKSDEELAQVVKKREERQILLRAVVAGVQEPGPETEEMAAKEEPRRIEIVRRERKFRLTSLSSAFGLLSVMLYDALIAKSVIVVFRG